MNDESFYRNLPAFKNFESIADGSHFYQVPDSWWIVITDVKGSTLAISEGRYQDVNLVGAASISAVLNILGDKEIPFIFGGDGATMLIPSTQIENVKKALLQAARLSQRNFHLQLRVGAVPVGELSRRNYPVMCGKHEVASGNFLAVLQGSGVSVAEKWVKEKGPQGENYLLQEDTEAPLDEGLLEGLSCRWQPVASANGKVVSLIVVPRADEILGGLLKSFERILANSANAGAPITMQNLKAAPFRSAVSKEARLSGKTGMALLKKWFLTLFWIVFARALFLFNIRIGEFSPVDYVKEICVNTDHKKFDHALRMVIDCTDGQIEALKYVLEDLREKNKIYFGMHVSSQALMTCFVRQPFSNRHIHFVDGAEGGYTLAAKELKSQMRGAEATKAKVPVSTDPQAWG